MAPRPDWNLPSCETACLAIRKGRACCRFQIGRRSKCKFDWVSAALAAAVWLTLTGVAQAEPLRIFYFTWVGYGPLFVAQERASSASEGVEVELIKLDDHTAAFSGLFAGQVDAIAAGTQDVLTFAEPDEDLLVCVLPLDESRGGDGILAIKEIQSIADLKGRSVAVRLAAACSSSTWPSC